LVAAVNSCAYLKKDVVVPPCTLPDSVSYARDVQPVISANCYACHSTASNISGILLDSYDRLKAYAQSGQLYGAISHSPGYRPMPDGGQQLPTCTIELIKKWIDSGTPR